MLLRFHELYQLTLPLPSSELVSLWTVVQSASTVPDAQRARHCGQLVKWAIPQLMATEPEPRLVVLALTALAGLYESVCANCSRAHRSSLRSPPLRRGCGRLTPAWRSRLETCLRHPAARV